MIAVDGGFYEIVLAIPQKRWNTRADSAWYPDVRGSALAVARRKKEE